MEKGVCLSKRDLNDLSWCLSVSSLTRSPFKYITDQMYIKLHVMVLFSVGGS